ncbi:arylesterase [Psychrobacter sp. FDAARGOS_221]|uniref:arylesterase n=1 Tax=Psychrobacter sp. FDAARGOS_221 TaxID=1975705 RepID=UPI000BB567F2|nr:arylesterase [Psychrobacter sp. FDAARGOS_221]PNK60654.1 arylesterase [Psychrobacter sp. FDAARGOS_221]
MSLAFLKPLTALVVASAMLIGCQPNTNDSNDAETADNAASSTESTTATNNTAAQQPTDAEITAQNTTSEEVIEQPVTILALGDSLTEGLGLAEEDAYPAQLEKALQQAGYVNAKVINSGLSGETSTGLVNRLDWVLKTKPDITILTIGANDAMRGIDVATVDSNIRTAIQRLQDEGSVIVLGGMQIYDNLGDEYVKSFSALYPKIAEDTGVAFIPFFLDGVGGVPELNQADAIHPTAEGYTRIVQNNILPVLKPTLAEFVDEQTADSAQP